MAGPWSELAGGLLWGLAAWEALNAWRENRAPRGLLWRGALALAFLAFRWPLWLTPHEFSPDESQSLAGALTLGHDPVFWRSVDGATAGPLHFFLLWPATLGPEGSAYFLSRLLGHALLLGTLFLTGRLIGRVDRLAEPLAVIPAVSAFAWSRATDFQHASTELLPCCLIALALVCHLPAPQRPVSSWIAGLALGLVPWAKLQAAPIAALLGLALVLVEFRAGRPRSAWRLGVAALLPTLLAAIGLSAFDLWPDMITPYLLDNTGYGDASRFTVLSALAGFGRALGEDGGAALWLATGTILLAVAWFAGRAHDSLLSDARLLRPLAWLWLLAAFGCVAVARRPFLHYWHLLSAPWLLTVGLAVAHLSAGRSWRRLAFGLAAAVLPLALHRLAGPDHFAWVRATYARFEQENRDLAALARPFLRPGDSVAIWGNRCGLYVALAYPQATRQAHTELQIRPGPRQAYFLRTYWEDFHRNRPALFVDATGAGNLGFDTPNQPHEYFLRLGDAVRRDYALVAHRHGTRLFVRRDRLPADPRPDESR